MDETTTIPLPPTEKPATVAPAKTDNAPPAQSIDDAYGDFDAAETKEPKEQAPKKELARQDPKSTSVQSAEEDAKATESTEKSTVKDTSTEKLTDSSQKQGEPKPVKAAELRNAYENLKREHHNLKAEFEKTKKAPQDDTRVKQLQELLDSERKARSDMEQELKFTAYEKSQEFKDKFQKPYMQAYQMGRQKTASLKVIESKNDMDEVVRPGRQGSEADFDLIMRIDDDDAAAEKAIELFGQKAQSVLYYRERVNELHQSSRSAIEEYRTNADKREKELSEARTRQESEQQQRAQAQAETFKKLVEEGVKAHPELFTPVEGDDESAAVLKRGQAVADSLFNGINPKTNRPYTPEGMVKFHAFVRNALAAHGHLLHKLKATETKLTELESDLAEYKKSGSSADSGRRDESGKGSSLPGEEEFDEAEARSPRRW